MTDECIYPKCLVSGTERTFRGSQCVCEARGREPNPMPHDAPIGPDPVRGTWHNLTPLPEGTVIVGSIMSSAPEYGPIDPDGSRRWKPMPCAQEAFMTSPGYKKIAPSDKPRWADCSGHLSQVDEYQKIARPRADNPSGFRLSDGTDISRMTADQINAHMRSPKFPTAEENRRQLHRARCLWVRGVLFAVGAVCAVAAVTGAHDSEVFKIGLSGLGASILGLLILRFCVEDNSNEAR